MRVAGACLLHPVSFTVISLLVAGADGVLARPWRNASRPRLARRVDCYSRYDGKPMLRMTPCTTLVIRFMRAVIGKSDCVDAKDGRGLRMLSGGCADTTFICPPATAEMLQGTFRRHVHLVLPDAGAQMRAMETSSKPARRAPFWRLPFLPFAATESQSRSYCGFWDQYQTLEAQTARIQELVQHADGHSGHNARATIEEIGLSQEGRPLHRVTVASAKDTTAEKKTLLLTFGMHAREWITGMAAIWCVHSLIERQKADPSYLEGLQVEIIPMANPDGFVYSWKTDRLWRKTRTPSAAPSSCVGVDMNRNFEVNFEGHGSTTTPCSETYRGPNPVSEKESEILKQAADAIEARKQPSAIVDFHSYSQYVLTPTKAALMERVPGLPVIDSIKALGKEVLAGIETARKLEMPSQNKQPYEYGLMEDKLYPVAGLYIDYTAKTLLIPSVIVELSPSHDSELAFALPTDRILSVAKDAFAGVDRAVAWLKSYKG